MCLPPTLITKHSSIPVTCDKSKTASYANDVVLTWEKTLRAWLIFLETCSKGGECALTKLFKEVLKNVLDVSTLFYNLDQKGVLV